MTAWVILSLAFGAMAYIEDIDRQLGVRLISTITATLFWPLLCAAAVIRVMSMNESNWRRK